MQDELVSFETAKLAKEKGFDIYQPYRYDDEKRIYHGRDQTFNINAPTQSLLQKWLRDEHDIFVSINTVSEERWYSAEDVEHIPVHKYRVIKNIDNFKYDVIDWSEPFETYEEALEVALFESLKLIKEI